MKGSAGRRSLIVMKQHKQVEYTIDQHGVVVWDDSTSNNTFRPGGRSPFERWLELHQEQVHTKAIGIVDAAVLVHDHLTTARTIAVAIFGDAWGPHLMDVYDRLVTASEATEQNITTRANES